MTEQLDPGLLEMFARPAPEVEDVEFTAGVVAKTRSLKYRVLSGLVLVVLAILLSAWLLAIPVQEFIQLVARAITTPLYNLGDGWLGWALSPVNNVASVLVISARLLRVAWKRRLDASYQF